MRAESKLILLLACNLVFARDIFRRESHIQIEVRVVLDEIRIRTNDVSAHWNERHRLQSAGDSNLRASGLDSICGDGD